MGKFTIKHEGWITLLKDDNDMVGLNPFNILVHPTKEAAERDARAKEEHFARFEAKDVLNYNNPRHYAVAKIEWEEEL